MAIDDLCVQPYQDFTATLCDGLLRRGVMPGDEKILRFVEIAESKYPGYWDYALLPGIGFVDRNIESVRKDALGYFITTDWFDPRFANWTLASRAAILTSNQQSPRKRTKPPRSKNEVVYFIEAVGSGRVKIGYTNNVQGRLYTLACGTPFELRVLHSIPGDVTLEHELHERFLHLRRHGEWFELSPELLSFISQLQGGQL